MSDSEEQLKRMVLTFRVSELQMLLGYAGKNKTGRKNELQSRALDIVRMRNPSIQQKIRELYKSIQLEMMSFGDRSQAAAAAGGAPTGILPAQRVPSGLNSMPTAYSQSGNVGGNMGVTVNSSGYSSRSSSAQVGQVTPMNSNVGYSSIQGPHNNSYPISPDVRLKKLPFYDILGELLKPSTLGSGRYQEGTFTFSLTPQQANKIAHSRDLRPGKQDYSVQVQMRFCLLETTCEQEDNFPPNITVKINDKMCPLPSPIPTNKANVEPKRPSRPVNITALCRISPTVTNRILVSCSSDYGRCYVISVYLVQKLTSEDLLHRLKIKGPRLADFTRSLIKQKLREDGECEIATTSLRCSLLCPLGKMRMVLPCRAETCNHLQCFDASLFLQMNERKPTWTCPVCDKGALYDNLVIDGYFQEVLQENGNCTEVTLQKDGGWTPLVPKKEPKEQQQQQQQQQQQAEKRKSVVAIETVTDDSEDSDEDKSKAAPNNDDSVVEEVRSKRKNPDVEVITLSDSDDDSSAPPSKRPAYQSSSNSSVPSSSSPSSASTATTNGSGNTSSSSVTSSTGSSALSSGNSSNAPNNGRAETSTPENTPAVTGSECTKSNDSWCVGEVDPGKRLIFRKSLSSSSSNSGGIFASNNGVPNYAASPASSGSTSPQVICLDSPASSPPHSPRPVVSQEEPTSSPQVSAAASTVAPSTTPVLSPPPVSSPAASVQSSFVTCSSPLSNPASVAASLASLGSELKPISTSSTTSPTIPLSSPSVPASITPVQSSSLSPTDPLNPASVSSANTFNMLQDPLSSSSYALNSLPSSNPLNPLSTTNTLTPPPYGIPSGLPLFNPLSIIPPTTSPNITYRPQDRYM